MSRVTATTSLVGCHASAHCKLFRKYHDQGRSSGWQSQDGAFPPGNTIELWHKRKERKEESSAQHCALREILRWLDQVPRQKRNTGRHFWGDSPPSATRLERIYNTRLGNGKGRIGKVMKGVQLHRDVKVEVRCRE
ncbi:hypothetical protein BJY52DRAFT_1230776 [Lactarius psammicola]|nr:hypothetical protein BJY52DRAFT_1230776 [Lactarius psammicola]